jgi:hypothetical protein
LLAPGFIGLRTNRTPGYPWRVEIALTIISEIWPWIVESAIQQVTTLTGMNPSVTMAYDADSAADTFDKRNVRDGHYVSWGYEHLIVKLDGTTNEPSVAAVSAAVSATDPNNPMTIGACSVLAGHRAQRGRQPVQRPLRPRRRLRRIGARRLELTQTHQVATKGRRA